jgi:hypothetical protein
MNVNIHEPYLNIVDLKTIHEATINISSTLAASPLTSYASTLTHYKKRYWNMSTKEEQNK